MDKPEEPRALQEEGWLLGRPRRHSGREFMVTPRQRPEATVKAWEPVYPAARQRDHSGQRRARVSAQVGGPRSGGPGSTAVQDLKLLGRTALCAREELVSRGFPSCC